MQTALGYPDPSAYEPEGRMAAIEREQARRAREIAVKAAAADYRARLADERTRAAAKLVEDVVGSPESADDYAAAPMELVKLAAVEGSGLDVRGVKVLADECARRAAWKEPGKYGPKASLSLGLDTSLEAMLDRLNDLRTVAVQGKREGEP